MGSLYALPCLDSDQMAASRRQELDIPRDVAAALGRSAVKAARDGFYVTRDGQEVVWREAVKAASAAKVSIAPDAALVRIERSSRDELLIRLFDVSARQRPVEGSGFGPCSPNRRHFSCTCSSGIGPRQAGAVCA